jgi:peroxiredoxin
MDVIVRVSVSRAAAGLCLALIGFMAVPFGCGSPEPRAAVRVPDVSLATDLGELYALRARAAQSRALVITFFSADCPTQRAHDARLRELYGRYRPQGVEFVAIDAEAGASRARAAREARERGYLFPILADAEGRVADALGAEYATYTVIVDPEGTIRYRGGIDSDMHHLRPDASMWVRDALDRLLAGRSPSPSNTKALGCPLQRR